MANLQNPAEEISGMYVFLFLNNRFQRFEPNYF